MDHPCAPRGPPRRQWRAAAVCHANPPELAYEHPRNPCGALAYNLREGLPVRVALFLLAAEGESWPATAALGGAEEARESAMGGALGKYRHRYVYTGMYFVTDERFEVGMYHPIHNIRPHHVHCRLRRMIPGVRAQRYRRARVIVQ